MACVDKIHDDGCWSQSRPNCAAHGHRNQKHHPSDRNGSNKSMLEKQFNPPDTPNSVYRPPCPLHGPDWTQGSGISPIKSRVTPRRVCRRSYSQSLYEQSGSETSGCSIANVLLSSRGRNYYATESHFPASDSCARLVQSYAYCRSPDGLYRLSCHQQPSAQPSPQNVHNYKEEAALGDISSPRILATAVDNPPHSEPDFRSERSITIGHDLSQHTRACRARGGRWAVAYLLGETVLEGYKAGHSLDVQNIRGWSGLTNTTATRSARGSSTIESGENTQHVRQLHIAVETNGGG